LQNIETSLKTILVTGNRLLPNGNRLPESKNSGSLEDFRKSFLKQKVCYLMFFEKYFLLPTLTWIDAS